MSNKELSDSFDTLLDSFASQAQFGRQASDREIVLDEYEKSVFLTQAQDITVKSFFDRNTNSEDAGFDDNIRRQMDFSSLVATASLGMADNQSTVFDDRGILYIMPMRKTINDVTDTFDPTFDGSFHSEDGGSITTDVLFILNERLITEVNGIRKNYVVVPINYREYDREMSKPYAQPLKKQAWRLLQNNAQGFDIKTELIPRWDLSVNENIIAYRIRYVRRPYPIVLIDLPDGLNIDGFTRKRQCELNPILHPEILRKAVEIAAASKGLTRLAAQDSSTR